LGYVLGYVQPVHWIVRIDQDRNFRGGRNHLPQRFYRFADDLSLYEGRKTSYLAAWMR
jgi:hypothetical protein